MIPRCGHPPRLRRRRRRHSREWSHRADDVCLPVPISGRHGKAMTTTTVSELRDSGVNAPSSDRHERTVEYIVSSRAQTSRVSYHPDPTGQWFGHPGHGDTTLHLGLRRNAVHRDVRVRANAREPPRPSYKPRPRRSRSAPVKISSAEDRGAQFVVRLHPRFQQGRQTFQGERARSGPTGS